MMHGTTGPCQCSWLTQISLFQINPQCDLQDFNVSSLLCQPPPTPPKKKNKNQCSSAGGRPFQEMLRPWGAPGELFHILFALPLWPSSHVSVLIPGFQPPRPPGTSPCWLATTKDHRHHFTPVRKALSEKEEGSALCYSESSGHL